MSPTTPPELLENPPEKTLKRYYGYDPDREYVMRSPMRGYNGVTEHYRFTNGQAGAGRVRLDRGDEQHLRDGWNRGQRLATLVDDGYRVYPRGDEPSAAEESLWSGQDTPEGEGEVGVDLGEERPGWQPVETPMEKGSPEKLAGSEYIAQAGDHDMGEQDTAPVTTGVVAPS